MAALDILHRCFRCGYCKLPGTYTDINCPAYLAFRFETFSPGGRMWLLRGLLQEKLSPTPRFQEILFSCATCGNCTMHCAFPSFRDQLLDAFAAGKEMLVEAGTVPPAVRDYLTRLQAHGNAFKMAAKKRAEWAVDLDIPDFSNQEYLFYVDDVGAYDSRGVAITRAVAQLLQKAGVSFAILRTGGVSDGNDARAMGEKALSEYLAEQNIKAFQAAGVRRIITNSPHSFNTLKKDYPALGGDFKVYHYPQLLARYMATLPFDAAAAPVTVSYHDPCYLGRHNNDYWTARGILSAVPGIRHVEMERHMQNALCCGGGGGNYFTDILGGGADSPARTRVREAAASGAAVLATACPMCTGMLEDAIKTENLDQTLQVRELSELLLERLQPVQ